MIVTSLKSKSSTPTEIPSPSPEDIKKAVPKADIDSLNKLKSMGDDVKDDDIAEMVSEAIINEILVRELKQISNVVIKEDFYGFINAGNNIIRTLEENGIERPKKYLEYLTKHNIM